MCTVIQGSADIDVGGKLTQEKVSKTVEFCFNAFAHVTPDQRQAVLDKLNSVKDDPSTETKQDLEKLTDDELAILRTIRARQMMRTEDAIGIDTFSNDPIDGLLPRLVTGKLGLEREKQLTAPPAHLKTLFDVGMAGESATPEIKTEA